MQCAPALKLVKHGAAKVFRNACRYCSQELFGGLDKTLSCRGACQEFPPTRPVPTGKAGLEGAPRPVALSVLCYSLQRGCRCRVVRPVPRFVLIRRYSGVLHHEQTCEFQAHGGRAMIVRPGGKNIGYSWPANFIADPISELSILKHTHLLIPPQPQISDPSNQLARIATSS
jgi:hypothetical protein